MMLEYEFPRVPGSRYQTTCVSSTNSAGEIVRHSGEIRRAEDKEPLCNRLDIEYAATRNQGSSAGSATVARSMASTESWISSNRTSVGTGTAQTTPGFSGGTVAAPTDSTVTGSFTETTLKNLISEAWNDGGNPNVVLVGSGGKRKISTFTGIATLYRDAGTTSKGTRIIGAADIYVSDFGEHRIVPSRFCRDVTVQGLDMDYWAIASLRGMTKEKLAKTGDSEKWHLVTELTLEARQEASSFKIADVDTAK